MKLRLTVCFLVGFCSVSLGQNRDAVTKLSIIGEGSKRVPDSVYQYKNLAELELANFRLSRIPRKLSHLKKIQVVENHPRVRLRLPKSTTITALIIRGDTKGKLPRSYKRLENLEYLNLSSDKLRKFPNTKGCDKLSRLTLVRNAITLDKRPRHLPTSITKIDLTFNQIEVLPSWIGELKKLTVLNLANNKIERVEPGLENIPNLQELSFYNNQLKEIPPMIYGMTSLKVIDLYYNRIPAISRDIANWKDLEIIYLANNEIDVIPEEIGQLTKLKELYIHHNKLSSLPASIGDLKNLTTLRFNHNSITEWQPTVAGLKSLVNLDLSSNKLQSLPVSDLDFPDIKLLQMGGNPWNAATQKAMEAWAKKLRENQTVVRTDITP